MQPLHVMKSLSICTNTDFSTGHWRGCGENTALGWWGTHPLLPPTLTWNASSLAKCSLSLLGKGDSGTHTYSESWGNTHTLLPACVDILHSWLTPDRIEVKCPWLAFSEDLQNQSQKCPWKEIPLRIWRNYNLPQTVDGEMFELRLFRCLRDGWFQCHWGCMQLKKLRQQDIGKKQTHTRQQRRFWF